MKKIINNLPAILLSATLIFTACKKTELPNTAPLANAGKDTAYNLTTSILLDGSASTDKENNIVSYQWKLVSGPSAVNIVRPDLAKTAVINLVKGTYKFELTVTDQGGLSSTAAINIFCISYTKITDTTIRLPYNRALLNVEIAGYNSQNQEFKWEKISGPNSASINYPKGNKTIVSNLTEGIYQFEVTIKHTNQLTEKDTMTVTVLPNNNMYTAEKLFESLEWIDKYPISSITVNNISSFLTPGKNFEVYVKKDMNAAWQIVCPELKDPYHLYSYYYSIDNNVLKVFIDYDPTGWGDNDFGKYLLNPAIKIVY